MDKNSYFYKRIHEELGLSEEEYTIDLWSEITDEETRKVSRPIFSEDQNGNIRILVYNLKRQVVTYERDHIGQTERLSENARSTADYYITRLSPDYLKEHPGMPKYLFPGGETKKGTYPWFPPALLEKYEKAQQIETLVLTEGYFKAMTASRCGIDCVGLGSVTLFAEKSTQRLYSDITRLINRCKPHNIVVLYDGDCTDLSTDRLADINAGKAADVGQRPQMFFNSLMRLRELLIEYNDCELHFEYVRKMLPEKSPKGLDDLLVHPQFKALQEEIADDLNHPGRPGVYFEKLNLRTGQKKLRPLFHLSNPQMFYEAHAAELGTKRFKFGGAIYHYNQTETKLENDKPAEIENMICVNSTYYMREVIPGARDDDGAVQLIPIQAGILNSKFGKGTTDIILRTSWYKAFVNRPSHTDYQQEIKGYYNIYSELTYNPEHGSWDNIHHLLNHIFGADGTPQYEMALDYLQILYQMPTQILPVLCLISKERGTGKTSFLNLLKYMFESNCVIGGNDIITGQFNSAMAGKLVIGIDETSLADNQMITEKIKMLATSETVLMEAKGKDKIEMANFCKFVMCSNNERKFIYTSQEEIRFWVVKVKPLTEEEMVPNISELIEGEVPAFVFYLLGRKLYVPKAESRMWFDARRIKTKELQDLIDAGRPLMEQSIREYLKDLFILTGWERIYLDAAYFKANIDDFRNKDLSVVRIIIENNLGAKRNPEMKRYTMPYISTFADSRGEVIFPETKTPCRAYEFNAKDYLDEYAYNDLIASKHRNEPATAVQQELPIATAESADSNPEVLTPGQNDAALI